MNRILFALIFVLIVPAAVMASSGNPPNGKTGAPGEGTCRDCHSSFPLNSGNGNLSITGPSEFIPGGTYPITVTLSDPGQSRWGFEITPLNTGSVTITDPVHTQFASSGGRLYVKQNSAGTYNGNFDGPISWSIDWTAPADPPDQVIFYASGNAANGNNNTSGDYIYTTSFATSLPTFDIQVDIGDFFFSPQTIQIDPGQTVRWVNTSMGISHSSTSDDAFWDSGLISPGGHFDYTFSDAGTFGYHCTPHPSMMATVEVGGGAGGCQYAVGDVNGSGGFNGLDVTYGVSYLKGGNPPTYECECVPGNTWFVTGDVNGSCTYNGLDITYGVSYLKGGSGLTPCADCPPAR